MRPIRLALMLVAGERATAASIVDVATVKARRRRADGALCPGGSMVVLQLVGQGAFIAASFLLGGRLLRLWQRTGEAAELSIGLSFLLGGGIGYLAWFALALAAGAGASLDVLRAITLGGLACTCLGALANGAGIRRIFRPDAVWPLPGLAGLALWMVGWFVYALVSPPARSSLAFWAALLAIVPIYAWAAGEAWVLARALHRRARLGLADPVVVNRIAQWGVSGGVVVLMTGLSFVSRLVHGPVLPPWVSSLNAVLGLLAAAAIWLGFFPPRALRERLARGYAS
jgi:hypothetical protein